MKSTRKDNEGLLSPAQQREDERAKAWEWELQAAYRKVGPHLALVDDPLDKRFNKYPYRWPDFARYLHKTALTELYREHDRPQIEAAIRLDAERMAAIERKEGETVVVPVPAISPVEMSPWFPILLHGIYTLKAWKEEGADAGMRVWLGDAESAELCRLGVENADRREQVILGKQQQTEDTAAKHADDAEWYKKLALKHWDEAKGKLAEAVKLIMADEKLQGRERSRRYVYARLRDARINRDNYLTFGRDDQRTTQTSRR